MSKPLVGRSFMTDVQRDQILELLPHAGEVLEIGTGHGMTVAYWAQRRPEVRFLSVDIFRAAEGTGPGVIEDWLVNRQPNQHLFVGTAADLAAYGGEALFAAAFVDGGHGYTDCLNDLRAVQGFIAGRGKLLVHDYRRLDVPNLRGVTKAVDEFRRGWHWILSSVVGCVAVLTRPQSEGM